MVPSGSEFTCVYAKSLQSFRFITTLWSLTDSPVHGILQSRILEQVATLSSRGSSWLRDWTCVSYVSCTGRSFTSTPPGKPLEWAYILVNQWMIGENLGFFRLEKAIWQPQVMLTSYVVFPLRFWIPPKTGNSPRVHVTVLGLDGSHS